MDLYIDCGSVAYRMVHASTRRSGGGEVGSGLHLHYFLNTLRRYVREYLPDRVIVAFDTGYSPRRKALAATYKAERGSKVRTPEALLAYQCAVRVIDQLREVLPALGVRSLQLPCREADDILAATVGQSFRAIIVSEDKDMLQLVDDKVSVYRPRADQLVRQRNFEDVTGYANVDAWLLAKLMVGDNSDGVPGVPQVGPKTALTIATAVGEYDLDRLFEYLDGDESSKREKRVLDHLDVLDLNLELLDLHREVFDAGEMALLREMRDGARAAATIGSAHAALLGAGLQQIPSEIGTWFGPFQGLA
jgi:DNA polymerase I